MGNVEKRTIKWVDVIHSHYSYAFGVIFEGIQLKYRDDFKIETFIICIKQKDIMKICQLISVFNDIVHGEYLDSF